MAQRKPRKGRNVSAWLEPEEWLRVNAYARKRGLSRSGVIREAILNIIEGKVPEDVVKDPERTHDVPKEEA